MADNLNRKLVAIMFADIVSYSRLMGSDEGEALKLLKDFENISTDIVKKYNGMIIKKNGDEIFCEFSSAKNAVDASLKIQNELSKYNDSRPKDFKLEVRIGIHIGDVVKREDGDIHGDGVNVAARIQPLASPGGICVSGSVSDALSSHPDYNIISKGEQELKNILQKHSIFQVKTGHETIEPQKYADSDTKIKYLKHVIGIIAITIATIFIGYNGNWRTEKHLDLVRNYFIDISSNHSFAKYYQKEFNPEKYIISSISDSLLNQIKISLQQKIIRDYANLDVNIDVNFNNIISDVMDTLPYHRHGGLDSIHWSIFQNVVINNAPNSSLLDEHYNLTDAGLFRILIYDIKSLENNDSFIISDEAVQTRNQNIWQSTSDYKKYFYTYLSLDSLKDNLYHYWIDKWIRNITFSAFHIAEVVEVIDDRFIKIKQHTPGTLRAKLLLNTGRTYYWNDGGYEIRIEDLLYMRKHHQRENEYEKIINIDSAIEDVENKMKNDYYNDNTSIMMRGNCFYTVQVINVIDSIAIAEIIDPSSAMYFPRIGDYFSIKSD